ncbi:MAG: hypothetical protein OSB09_02770 [Planctomycetota bacterium]|nr:hypothetical protein [Planctomycetota bacterium]
MNRWKTLLIALSLSSSSLVAQDAQEAAQEPTSMQFHFSSMGKPLPELKLEQGDRWFNATKGLSVAVSPLAVLGRGKPLLVAYTIPG